MLIAVIGPYGRRAGLPEEQIEANVQAAIEAGRQLALRGHVPVVPHFYHFLNQENGQKQDKFLLPEDRWLELTTELVMACPACLMIGGWQHSDGAMHEWRMMASHGRKIYYSLEEVPYDRDRAKSNTQDL